MQTTAERREALLEHMELLKKLPPEGLRLNLNGPDASGEKSVQVTQEKVPKSRGRVFKSELL
jgi:hypothetical protein